MSGRALIPLRGGPLPVPPPQAGEGTQQADRRVPSPMWRQSVRAECHRLDDIPSHHLASLPPLGGGQEGGLAQDGAPE